MSTRPSFPEAMEQHFQPVNASDAYRNKGEVAEEHEDRLGVLLPVGFVIFGHLVTYRSLSI